MRHFILLIAISFIFNKGICYSQKGITDNQLLKQYSDANKYYEKAVQSGLQSNTNESEELKYNQLALIKFSALDKLLDQNPSDSIRFFTLLKLADLNYYFDSVITALGYYQKAIKTGTKLSTLPDSFLFKPYLFSGNIYFQNNQLDSAQASFRHAEQIQNHYTNKLQESERLYNDFGVLYYQSGNYKQAKNYFRKASEVLPRDHPYYKNLFVNYRINFATVLFKLENYDSAYAILVKLLPYKQHLNEINNNIGLIDFYSGKPLDAIQAFKRIHYTDKLNVGLYNDIATAWLSLKKYDSAVLYLNKAFQANVVLNHNYSSIDHGLSYKIQGDLLLQQHQPSNALSNYQLALHQFFPAFTDTSIFKNPSVYTGVFSYINLFKTLVGKAEAFHSMYLLTRQISWAESELNTYVSAYALFDFIERVYDSDEARLFLEKSKYLIHQKPIDIAFEVYNKTRNALYLEKAYELDEKTKASVLIFNEQQNRSGGSSLKGHDPVQQLKEEITRLSLKANGITDAHTQQIISNQISDKEIALGKLMQERSKTHPLAWYQIPSAQYLQQQLLDGETIIITYHLTEDKLTRFYISKNRFTGSQKNKYAAFNYDLKQTINNWQNGNGTINNEESIQRLYQFLLGDLNIKSAKQLIIIPDNELNYLPFEALKIEGHYLIESHSVQYQYSTLLLKKETQDFRNLETLSFAPFAQKDYNDIDLSFRRLPFSSQEINGNKGAFFMDEHATKENFINELDKYDIIHLATHSSSNSGNNQLSYIAFAPWSDTSRENFLLFASEIYNLSFKKNRLVILSACETGTGDLIKGEGVMSLSRAFEYSGCENIISSLWKADDEATSYIVQKFHSHLNKGESITAALQRAKEDYLSDPSINPRRKSPSYWAHLIYIGNYQPSYSNTTWLWILWISAIFITIFFIIQLRKVAMRRH